MGEMILWTTIAFFAGSIPFSLLVGYWALRVDIRQYGDGNPGATNVIRAGSVRWGIMAILLDFAKAAVPVGLANFIVGIDDWRIIPVAIAPIAGHAFSPWLKFKGGKAVAATFGIWCGLTLGVVPILLGIFLPLMFLVFEVDGWAVMFTLFVLAAHLLLNHNDVTFLGIWLGNTLVLAYKHRHDLVKSPGLRGWTLRILERQPQ
jgi:glycerol-3-phosphate acyltransferase PlsY